MQTPGVPPTEAIPMSESDKTPKATCGSVVLMGVLAGLVVYAQRAWFHADAPPNWGATAAAAVAVEADLDMSSAPSGSATSAGRGFPFSSSAAAAAAEDADNMDFEALSSDAMDPDDGIALDLAGFDGAGGGGRLRSPDDGDGDGLFEAVREDGLLLSMDDAAAAAAGTAGSKRKRFSPPTIHID